MSRTDRTRRKIFVTQGGLQLLLVLALVLSGCMLNPFDGQKVAARDTLVRASGFVDTPGMGIVIQAENVTTGGFQDVASATSMATSVPAVDINWYPWEASFNLGSDFWRPALRGFSARLQAKIGTDVNLRAFGEGGIDCIVRHGNRLADVITNCQSPSQIITLCTEDYLQAGARRGPCQRRTIDLLAGRRTVQRVFLDEHTQTHDEENAFDAIAWRGDGASFIDVYDEPLTKRDPRDSITSHGTPYSNFVRVTYPRPKTADELVYFDLNAILARQPTATPWQGAKTVRQYDRGECSAMISWREILDRIIDVYPEISAEADAAAGDLQVTLLPASRASLDPILRTGNTDGVGFFQRFVANVQHLGQLEVRVDIEGGLGAQEGRVRFSIEQFDVQIPRASGLLTFAAAFGFVNLEQLEASLSPRFRDRVEREIETVLRTRVPAGVIIHRVFARPEGFELVVAESTDETIYPFLRERGLCARPDGEAMTVTGHFDTLFEP